MKKLSMLTNVLFSGVLASIQKVVGNKSPHKPVATPATREVKVEGKKPVRVIRHIIGANGTLPRERQEAIIEAAKARRKLKGKKRQRDALRAISSYCINKDVDYKQLSRIHPSWDTKKVNPV